MFSFLEGTQGQRRVLFYTSATHVWSDLFFALLVPLLVLMKEDPELDLSFTEIGLLRTVHTGASAAGQVPFGFLAERTGEFWLLLGGNVWVAAGFIAMAATSTFPLLFSATLIGGMGGGTQHPLASSLVSREYERHWRSTAVGAVNFAGDLGKMAAPLAALVIPASLGWRTVMRIVGLCGIAFMAISAVARRGLGAGRPSYRENPATVDTGATTELGGFISLSAVGLLDSAVRAAALTFLPFLMRDKGMGTQGIFVMLFLLMTGGAIGKFVCGWLDERYGSVALIWATKGLTAGLLFVTLAAPSIYMGPLMIVLGIGLNGTSSVLYATVAKFVPPRLRARFYGFFYTTGEGGAALAPLLYGISADLLNIRAAVAILGVVTGLTLPVSLPLRRYLAEDTVVSTVE